MDKIYIDELLRYGRGTKYHIYGQNIGLQNTNIGLQSTNIGLKNSNIGLKKKRYSKEEMRELIIDYCQEWRTAEEIAVAVDKTTAYIRDIVLPSYPMSWKRNMMYLITLNRSIEQSNRKKKNYEIQI